MSINLENIWKSSISTASSPVSDFWWELIIQKYNENGRNGHNYVYLEEKFKELDYIKHSIKDLNAFTLALFFQYLEYSPKSPECHEKNLQSFNKFAEEADISNESNLFTQVKSLLHASAIHSTDEHKTINAYGEEDLHFFLDLDMCILGSPSEKYLEYIKNVRSEYSFLDLESYKNLRVKVLKSFLLIPNIFATKQFRDKFEKQARKNIEDELNSLMK